jgi:hypothetical protein
MPIYTHVETRAALNAFLFELDVAKFYYSLSVYSKFGWNQSKVTDSLSEDLRSFLRVSWAQLTTATLRAYGRWSPWWTLASVLHFLNQIDSRQHPLGGGSARRKADTYTWQHKHNKRRQTSIPCVGFETTTPVFERAKTVHALDRAATVIGLNETSRAKYYRRYFFNTALFEIT